MRLFRYLLSEHARHLLIGMAERLHPEPTEEYLMTTKRYLILFFIFALGLSLLVFGTAKDTETTLLGLTIHARVARGIGLITVLVGIVTALVMYGDSLPLTNTERTQQAARAARNSLPQTREEQASNGEKPKIQRPKQRPHSLNVTWGRTSTNSKVLVALEKKKQQPVQSNHAVKHH
jgi:hypothetical protein